MKKHRQRVSHLCNQLPSQSTAATTNPKVSLVATSKTKKPEDKAKLLGARRVWGTMKTCTVGSVKSIISTCCSNTTANLRRKCKDAQTGKPSKWWFIFLPLPLPPYPCPDDILCSKEKVYYLICSLDVSKAMGVD